MTTPETNAPIPLQRPPAPQRGFARVTRLSAPERDDVPIASVQGTLALDLDALPPPALEPPATHLALAPTPTDPADDVRRWAGRFAQAVVEVTGGDRPLTQLLRWTSTSVYQDLARRVQIMVQTRNAPLRSRRGTRRCG